MAGNHVCTVDDAFDFKPQLIKNVVGVRRIGVGVVLFGHLLPENQGFQRRDVDGLDQPGGGRYAANGGSVVVWGWGVKLWNG